MTLIVFAHEARLVSRSSLILLYESNGMRSAIESAVDGVATYIINTSSLHISIDKLQLELANVMVPSSIGVVTTPCSAWN